MRRTLQRFWSVTREQPLIAALRVEAQAAQAVVAVDLELVDGVVLQLREDLPREVDDHERCHVRPEDRDDLARGHGDGLDTVDNEAHDVGVREGEQKDIAESINRIGDGLDAAVEAGMKNERLKTDLITNVSHDIKTPLTSIINYADLIGKEVSGDVKDTGDGVGTETAQEREQHISEYAEVLLRQSQKLKKLLDDLLEASKATTGNLEVHPEVCDVSVLLSQAVGEYEQRFSEKKLETIVKQPEETVKVMADGRHLWRVFDNLLNNIYKYAQTGSRVYLNVEHDGQNVNIIFRNMSAYPLEMSPEELEERFTRGDRSRHMEGNGLGLSIAKSLTELQKGDMEIVTDGDLFKVVITLPETE